MDYVLTSVSTVNDPVYPDLSWKPEDGDGILKQLVFSDFRFENAVSVRSAIAFGDWPA